LNPAPATKLPDALLKKISVITPNETEAALLTGIPVTDFITAGHAARILKNKGIGTVIITLGSQGALLLEDDDPIHIPAPVVQPMDTTAAGDVFNGALAVALLENKTMAEAVRFGCEAASISVTRMGAQASAPYRHEIKSNTKIYPG
jgi:ribokinase